MAFIGSGHSKGTSQFGVPANATNKKQRVEIIGGSPVVITEFSNAPMTQADFQNLMDSIAPGEVTLPVSKPSESNG